MKTVGAIALVALLSGGYLIQSRRGVSEDRVKGQMDSDAPVEIPGAGAHKKKPPKIDGDHLKPKERHTKDVEVSFNGESLNELNTKASADENIGFESLRSQARLASSVESLSKGGSKSVLAKLLRKMVSGGKTLCTSPDQAKEATQLKEELAKLQKMTKDANDNFLKAKKGWATTALRHSQKLHNQIDAFKFCEDALETGCYWEGKQECKDNKPAVSPALMDAFKTGANGKSMVDSIADATMATIQTLRHSKNWEKWEKASGCQVDAQTPLMKAWASNWSCTTECVDSKLNQGMLAQPTDDVLKSCMDIIVPASGKSTSGCHGNTEKCYQNTWESCCCRAGHMFARDMSSPRDCKAGCDDPKASEWHFFTQQRMSLVMGKMFNHEGKRCDYNEPFKVGMWGRGHLLLAKRMRAMMETRVFNFAKDGMRPLSQESDGVVTELEEEQEEELDSASLIQALSPGGSLIQALSRGNATGLLDSNGELDLDKLDVDEIFDLMESETMEAAFVLGLLIYIAICMVVVVVIVWLYKYIKRTLAEP